MKRKTNIIILASLFLSALATSCITPRRVNYLQDMTQGSQIQIENKFEAAIAPYDELNIIVTTSSSKKELAENVIGAGGEAWITELGDRELMELLRLKI